MLILVDNLTEFLRVQELKTRDTWDSGTTRGSFCVAGLRTV